MTMQKFKNLLTAFFLLSFTFLLPVKNVFADLAPDYSVSNIGIENIMFALILLIVVIVAFYILMKSRKKNNDNDNK